MSVNRSILGSAPLLHHASVLLRLGRLGRQLGRASRDVLLLSVDNRGFVDAGLGAIQTGGDTLNRLMIVLLRGLGHQEIVPLLLELEILQLVYYFGPGRGPVVQLSRVLDF